MVLPPTSVSVPKGNRLLRGAVIATLLALFVALSAEFNLRLHSGEVYPHVAYLPIVLAAIWWGWGGLAVAGAVSAVLLAFQVAGVAASDLWTDLARVTLYLVVAASVAWLAERLRRASHAAEISTQNYRALLDNSLAGIMVYRNKAIVAANERLATMLALPLEKLVGLPIWKVVAKEDWPAVDALLARRAAGETRDLHYECRLARFDGTTVWAEMASTIVTYGGEEAVLVNAYDVTARREAEQRRLELLERAHQQQEQLVHSTRLAELGEMAAAVAHEINQPLTGIKTFASNAIYMMENDVAEPGEVKENLRRITEQVGRASRIIGQLRQLARRTEHQFAPVDLNGVVSETVEFLSSQMTLSGVKVDLALAPDLPEVMGDRIRLEQVLLNLLTNARQAMEDSPTRRLLVATRLEPAPEPIVAVAVVDTGRGFEQQEATRLFAPFHTTKKPGQGTGLGLSISLSIVKDHGGTIDARAEPGKGATFTVRLPVRAARLGEEGGGKDHDHE